MISILLIPVLGLGVLQLILFIFVPKRGSHVPSPADIQLLRRLRWAGTAVLACGSVAAAWVYQNHGPAGPDPRDVIGYENGYGYSIPILASQSKKAAVQEERMGGKFGVLLEKVEPWFVDQWHGRRLSTTLLVISGGIFLLCFIWARILTFPEKAEERGA